MEKNWNSIDGNYDGKHIPDVYFVQAMILNKKISFIIDTVSEIPEKCMRLCMRTLFSWVYIKFVCCSRFISKNELYYLKKCGFFRDRSVLWCGLIWVKNAFAYERFFKINHFTKLLDLIHNMNWMGQKMSDRV